MSKESNISVEALYLAEKKQKFIFMGASGVFAALFVFSLIFGWGAAQSAGNPQINNQGPNFQDGGRGGFGGGAGGPRGGFGIGGGIESFFSDDGSVDQEAVDQLAERAAQFDDGGQLAERFIDGIDTAENDGTITSDQANELRGALGL